VPDHHITHFAQVRPRSIRPQCKTCRVQPVMMIVVMVMMIHYSCATLLDHDVEFRRLLARAARTAADRVSRGDPPASRSSPRVTVADRNRVRKKRKKRSFRTALAVDETRHSAGAREHAPPLVGGGSLIHRTHYIPTYLPA